MMRAVVIYASKELKTCVIVPRKYSKDKKGYDDLLNSVSFPLYEVSKDFGYWIKKLIQEFGQSDQIFEKISLHIHASMDTFFKIAKVTSWDEFNEKYQTVLSVWKENKTYMLGLAISDRPEMPKKQISEHCKDIELRNIAIDMIMLDFKNYL